MTTRVADPERLNPCLQEQKQSYQCLDNNGYDHDKCTDYFDNYNTCKKFWGKVYNDRRAKGISPYLPPAHERAQIKSEYMKNVRDTINNIAGSSKS